MNKKIIVLFCIAACVVLIAFFIVNSTYMNKADLLIQDVKTEEVLKDEDGNEIMKVSTTLPKVVLESEQEDENSKLINKTINDYYENYINLIKGETFEIAKDNKQYSDSDYMFEAVKTNEIIREDKKVLSFKLSEMIYIGGAHGSHIIEGMNFDLINSKIIKFSDLFTVPKEAYESMLHDIVNAKLLEMKENEDLYLFDNYEDVINSAFRDNSFLLSDDSLIIIYQEYDVSSYAEGTKYIEISFDEISDIFNTKYKK